MTPRSLLVLALGVGCAPDEPPVLGERVWAGEHLEVWGTDQAEICAGSYEALDRHAELLSREAEALGVQTYAARYRYYWLTPEQLAREELCSEGASGCVLYEGEEPSVYANGHFVHELVHAELASSHHSFVDEGLAVMFGDSELDRDDPEGRPTIPDLVDTTAGQPLDFARYRQAGSFVRAVEDLYPETYLPALVRSLPDDDFAQLEDRAAAEDVDLAAAVDLYASEEGCSVPSTRIALVECSVEPTAWNEDRWSVAGSVDCDAADTLGPSAQYAKRWTVRSVEIPESGQYTAWLETGDDVLVTMVYCDARWCGSGFRQSGNSTILFPGALAPLELEAGRYWFRIEQDIADPTPGAFEINLIPGWHDEDPRE